MSGLLVEISRKPSRMEFDYDNMYQNQDSRHFEWVKKTGLWKARVLCDIVSGQPTNSVLEIGTGRGDVLNACTIFKERIGADISSEALEQQRKIYGTEKLVRIDANGHLPFETNEVDFVLLCDILEHVEKPIDLLNEAARVGSYVMLKIPIEKALLTGIARRLHRIKYGQSHPSGHLHCWNISGVLKIIKGGGLEIINGKFVGTPIELVQKGNPLKNIMVWLTGTCDRYLGGDFLTRNLIGGSFFAIAKKVET